MIRGVKYHRFNFPCGEIHVKIDAVESGSLYFQFDKCDDILELLFVADAMKRKGVDLETLTMPYVPFSRQDRVAAYGESFSLAVFADLINGMGFKHVIVTDPHSDVTPALIKNCRVIHQSEVFKNLLKDKKDFWLISPDGGALKKIYTLAQLVQCVGVIECSKNRNVNSGEINATIVHSEDLQGKDAFIVDDICDGGRTFVEIAKVLKQKNCDKITLLVTHGFFTNGIEVFDGLIDEIYTMKGRVK